MKCSRCGSEMEEVKVIQGSPYPMGHWICKNCRLVISNK